MILNIDCKTNINCDNCGNPLLPTQECVHINNKINMEDYFFCNDTCKQNFIKDNFVTDKVSVADVIKKTSEKVDNRIYFDDEIKSALEDEAKRALL